MASNIGTMSIEELHRRLLAAEEFRDKQPEQFPSWADDFHRMVKRYLALNEQLGEMFGIYFKDKPPVPLPMRQDESKVKRCCTRCHKPLGKDEGVSYKWGRGYQALYCEKCYNSVKGLKILDENTP